MFVGGSGSPLSPTKPTTEESLLRVTTAAFTAANNVSSHANDNVNAPILGPVDIGFFNPARKTAHTLTIIDGGKTTYVDVFSFTDRLKHMAATTPDGEAQVRRAWTACLQGPALEWFSYGMSPAARRELQTTRVEIICAKLIQRFKPSPSEALTNLTRSEYTLWDVQQSKDILSYVHCVVGDAKEAGFTDRGQLVAAFDLFDADIQTELAYPTVFTTLDSFKTNIRDRWPVLQAKARHRYARSSGSNRGRVGTCRTRQPVQHLQSPAHRDALMSSSSPTPSTQHGSQAYLLSLLATQTQVPGAGRSRAPMSGSGPKVAYPQTHAYTNAPGTEHPPHGATYASYGDEASSQGREPWPADHGVFTTPGALDRMPLGGRLAMLEQAVRDMLPELRALREVMDGDAYLGVKFREKLAANMAGAEQRTAKRYTARADREEPETSLQGTRTGE